MRIAIGRRRDDRPYEDDEVARQRPVLYVEQVILDALCILSGVSVSPRTPCTCAQPVMPGLTLWQRAYLAMMCSCSRLCDNACGRWAEERHLPPHHVDQLRKLIEVPSA